MLTTDVPLGSKYASGFVCLIVKIKENIEKLMIILHS